MSYDKICTTLEIVKPHKTTLIVSCPCEDRTAHNRNETVKAMNNDNVGAVKYRYLQSKKGRHYTLGETALSASCSIAAWFFLYMFYQLLSENLSQASAKGNQEHSDAETAKYFMNLIILFILMFTTIPSVNTLIQIRNALRYNETKAGCEKWFEIKVDPDELDQIKSLNWNNDYQELKTEYGTGKKNI